MPRGGTRKAGDRRLEDRRNYHRGHEEHGAIKWAVDVKNAAEVVGGIPVGRSPTGIPPTTSYFFGRFVAACSQAGIGYTRRVHR